MDSFHDAIIFWDRSLNIFQASIGSSYDRPLCNVFKVIIFFLALLGKLFLIMGDYGKKLMRKKNLL